MQLNEHGEPTLKGGKRAKGVTPEWLAACTPFGSDAVKREHKAAQKTIAKLKAQLAAPAPSLAMSTTAAAQAAKSRADEQAKTIKDLQAQVAKQGKPAPKAAPTPKTPNK